jgi:hypothetical protein
MILKTEVDPRHLPVGRRFCNLAVWCFGVTPVPSGEAALAAAGP